MKITVLAVLFLLPSYIAHAQVGFSTSGSSWGPGNSFFGDGSGANPFRTAQAPGGTTAYGAGSANGSQFVFGFAKEFPVDTSSYNLAETDLALGTSLTLVLTGFTALPKYVAYTGGSLTGYAFDSALGRLTLSATTVNAVPSSSVVSAGTLGSAFGLVVETGGGYDFGGSIFRTDGYWGDIASLNASYAGGLPLAGVNFSGSAGSSVTFEAYLTTGYLSTIGINTPAECAAYLQKQNTSSDLSITRQLFTAGGVDPNLPRGGYTFGGASSFDINGGGVADNYIIAGYSNASWSEGNIGVVPEPSTNALLVLSTAVLGVCILRRRCS